MKSPIAALFLAALVSNAALAASAPPSPKAPPLEAWAKLPDWSGAWAMIGPTVFDAATVEPKGGGAGTPGVREHPPYNAEWEAKYVKNQELVKTDRFVDPNSFCGTPAYMPRMMNLPDAIEWAVRPDQVWHIVENGSTIRRIYTDGRPHLKGDDLFPTYTGDNIGHWEGDTLVVDTIGLRDDLIIDRTGLIHSSAMHVVQRIRLVEPDILEAQMVLEDPIAFTAPWKVTKRYRRLPPGSYVFDYACAENNRNPITADGRTLTKGADGKVIDKAK